MFADPVVRQQSDAGGYSRGVTCFRSGAVRRLVWDEDARTLRSVVAGSRPSPYRCTIVVEPRAARPIVSTSCTCPMAYDCKHVVATLLESNRVARAATPLDSRETGATPPDSRETGATPTPEPAPAEWRSLLPPAPRAAARRLALGVELRQRVRRGGSPWAPPRTEPATPRGLHEHGHELSVALRPLETGARDDTWIKGVVSWDALRRAGHPWDHAQARWFVELFSIARDARLLGTMPDGSEWLTLDDVESSLLWTQLAGAEGRGIPIVATRRRQSVSLARAAAVGLHAEHDARGIVISPHVMIDGDPVEGPIVRTIGHVGVYAVSAVGETLRASLAPVALSAAEYAALRASAPVVVPPSDAAEFIRDHLPHLARLTTLTAGPGIEVPDSARPRLAVSVGFEPSHRLQFALTWRYPGAPPVAEGTPPDAERDAAAEDEIRRRLEAVWRDAVDVPFASSGTLAGVEAAEFTAHALPALEALEDVVVELRGTRPAYRELTADPRVTVSTVETDDADWFDLGVVVTIDGRRIPFTPLFTALSRGRKKLLLADGGFFSLSHPALQRLRELIDEAADLAEWEAGTTRISRRQTDLWADFEDVADEALPAVSWRATVEALRDVDGIEPTRAPDGLRARLRPYQQAGFDWLAFLWRHRLGGILADDMGLGKTLQMLALLQHAVAEGERRPFLVVAPTSVLSTWRAEAARFVPGLRVRVLDTTGATRREPLADAAASVDVVVTSYTLLRLDASQFHALEWAGVVLDEAQFVKNPQTKAFRAVRDLRADVAFAITGTPLENGLAELWALLSLTAPGLFPSARRFREEYVQPIEKGRVPENRESGPYRAARLARLRRRIRPLVLRRTKEAVAADLPPKQEQEVRVELGAAHRALYDAVLQRERQKVLGLLDDLDRNRFIVFRSLTLLRMLSLAPELVDPEHAHIAPSKLTALFEQLDEIVAEGHRTLVFSQFTSFLQLVAAQLDARGIAYAYLDGSTRDRDAAIDAFRRGDAPVFLISLKAGGFGLTLTEADYVFLLDPWWNPAAEAQAVDRAHRIGQTRSVMVYRLIANGTIEEKVMALQQRKARLFRSVMDDDALFGQALSAADIRGLLER
nr:DEAD/DEAH box helicase [Microbacterium ulmi]